MSSELQKRGVSYRVTTKFTFGGSIFNGASVQLNVGFPTLHSERSSSNSLSSSPDDLDALSQVQHVVGIYPVRFWKVSPWHGNPPRPPGNSTSPPDIQSAHQVSGIDKLHAEGYLGQGIQVAVLDSGVDYTLPVLGGGFGPGHKVNKGYDFVGDVSLYSSYLMSGS